MPQHVTQRGNNRSVLFVRDSDYRFFLDNLRIECDRFGCLVHAYVLMTNHVHLLMTPSTASGISDVMQAVGRRYVRCFNDAYGRTGTLCQGRFKATVVDTDYYLLACYRYIELNPVRGGLVADPREYRWSSYGTNASGRVDPLITPHERYDAIGATPDERQRAYRALVAAAIPDATLDEIRRATNTGWALGGQRFRDEVAALLARRTQPATRGARPRKKDVIRI
jgi:putative transposase